MAGNNRALKEARKKKDDEFYTTYEAIEGELKHYGGVFEGKVVYCPCDDYRWSEFVHYFRDNFKRLGLKELIATNYDIGEGSYIYSYKGNGVDVSIKHPGTGSYREFDRLLERCDIVCTNPPFSLFKDFVEWIVAKEKKFIVMGPKTAFGYNDVFRLVKEGRLWTGITHPNTFKRREDMNGLVRWYVFKFDGGACNAWFNTEEMQRRALLRLTESYWEHPEKYPKYEDFDAINVDRVKDIPYDYDGLMGVPITFLDGYYPEHAGKCVEFDLVDKIDCGHLPGRRTYRRAVIKKKTTSR